MSCSDECLLKIKIENGIKQIQNLLIESECNFCKETYIKKYGKIKNSSGFCSAKCQLKNVQLNSKGKEKKKFGEREIRNCCYCKNKFEVLKRSTKILCSTACSGKYRQPGMIGHEVSEKTIEKIQKGIKEFWENNPEKRKLMLKASSERWKLNNPMNIPGMRKQIGDKISKILKAKILDGTFTPNIINSRTNLNALIKLDNGEVKKFRSSWEACFWYCNQHLLFEKIRIPYFNTKTNSQSTYIADFFDEQKRIIYEIKPKSNQKNQSEKFKSAEDYCLKNNYKFIIIDENTILSYINIKKFKNENKLILNKLLKGIKYVK